MSNRTKTIGLVALVLLLTAWCTTSLLLWRDFGAYASATKLNPYKRIELMAQVLSIITRNYVDEVDPSRLLDGAVDGMLRQLDPHSNYLRPKRLERLTEQLRGDYEGIGIYYDIRDGILTVISPLEGSPSDRLGIRAGDQILSIEGTSAIGIKSEEVQAKLRGPRGTSVSVSVRRAGEPDLLSFTIIRDNVLIRSVPYSFMIRPGTAYARIGRFSSTTASELREHLEVLEAQGTQRLLLDLRGNGGGLLEHAVKVAGMFIEKNRTIVYTRGQLPEANVDYQSSEEPLYAAIPLIVLIDRGSASASEIVSGAVQDCDRGLVVGQTSFGKGLVQQRFPRQGTLEDGAALLLTVARWYTPSGRLIQRPYATDAQTLLADASGDGDSPATADTTRPVHYTSGGRKVYGGGGITPDLVLEEGRLTELELLFRQHNAFFGFATKYVGEHKDMPGDFELFLATFEISDESLGHLAEFARSLGVSFETSEFEAHAEQLRLRTKQEIAGVLWGWRERAWVAIVNDPEVGQAMDLFGKAEELLHKG